MKAEYVDRKREREGGREGEGGRGREGVSWAGRAWNQQVQNM